jgi:hypothetical protein
MSLDLAELETEQKRLTQATKAQRYTMHRCGFSDWAIKKFSKDKQTASLAISNMLNSLELAREKENNRR